MSVSVHLEGDGLQFDDETTVFNAAQIIGFLKNSESMNSSASSAASPIALGLSKPKVSPREALLNSGAKTNPQKITALGNYLAGQNGHEGFLLEEVRLAFRKAGEPLPKNFSRDVKEAIEANLIFEDGDQYILTEAALEQLETGFKDSPKKAKTTSVRRAKSAVRSQINDELLNLLGQKGAGLKSYIAEREAVYNGRASDQLAIIATWLLDDLQMKGLSASDLGAVRRYLGEPIGNASSQIHNAYARDGYFANSKDGRFFLSSKGEDMGRIKSLQGKG